MLAVHAVQADAGDVARLAATATPVAHCPRSNLRLHCGIAPVAEMMAAGVVVGLGTDSLASNDSLDMFAEMRAALAVSRERAAAGALQPPLTAEAVLRMATLDGARALGWDHLIGSLEAGKRADVVAVGLSQSATGEAELDPVALIVSVAAAEHVRLTMVDGRVIYDAKESPAVPDEMAAGFFAVRRKLGLAR